VGVGGVGVGVVDAALVDPVVAAVEGVGERVAGVEVVGDGHGGVVEDRVEAEVFEIVVGCADEAPVG